MTDQYELDRIEAAVKAGALRCCAENFCEEDQMCYCDSKEHAAALEKKELAECERRLAAAEKVVEAFETERKAGRFYCECEWAPDEYTTLVRRCVTHQALDEYQNSYRKAHFEDLTDADADLIAAAPELYECLLNLVEQGMSNETPHVGRSIFARELAALRKAGYEKEKSGKQE